MCFYSPTVPCRGDLLTCVLLSVACLVDLWPLSAATCGGAEGAGARAREKSGRSVSGPSAFVCVLPQTSGCRRRRTAGIRRLSSWCPVRQRCTNQPSCVFCCSLLRHHRLEHSAFLLPVPWHLLPRAASAPTALRSLCRLLSRRLWAHATCKRERGWEEMMGCPDASSPDSNQNVEPAW